MIKVALNLEMWIGTTILPLFYYYTTILLLIYSYNNKMIIFSYYIIKFVGFMSIYYAINVDIVSSYMIFSNLYIKSIDLLHV